MFLCPCESTSVNSQFNISVLIHAMYMFLCTQYSFPYIKSPMFVLNSLYDTAQLAGILKLPCLPPNCTDKEMMFFYDFEHVSPTQLK